MLVAVGYFYRTEVEAQVFALGSCPSVNVVSNFNVSQVNSIRLKVDDALESFPFYLRYIISENSKKKKKGRKGLSRTIRSPSHH